jgi:hypothetical protein
MSGKAMQVFVPRGETALREIVMRFESEGHNVGFAASFVHREGALAEPKRVSLETSVSESVNG